MAEGLKISGIVINWGMIAAALLALAFMYNDVQNLKKSQGQGVSPERIAKAEAAHEGMEKRLDDVIGRVERLERSQDWQRRREEERAR